MKENVLVVHGGGPTAVMNASLYGVIKEAKKHQEIGVVYGAIGGILGIIKERFVNLSQEEEEQVELLLHTPGSAIGSSRYPVTLKDYEKIPSILEKYNIRYLLPNGGNGTMDTCGKIYKECLKKGYDKVKVVGIPKTIDNDIAITDHTPGFGSAARYLAATTQEIAADIRSLPIHVCIIEALGRNTGWIAASAALARKKETDAPHLIYLPERPFQEEEFLQDVKALYEEKGGVVVVASEGLKYADGTPIVEPVFQTERAVYYGDVSAHLANLVIKKLGIKARSEKPGLSGRSSIAWQSPVDQKEAVLAGAKALEAAIAGENGIMIGFQREENQDGSYIIKIIKIPVEQVMMLEKTVPECYINERGNNVTQEFLDWCSPLIGGKLPEFIDYDNTDKKGKE
ncbi:MAG: diphosphate--fructose-6-phosphate 1-phosphotransferase [Lachnospiraceae bacterium]